MTGELADAALTWAGGGWPVFALAPGSKRPPAGSLGVYAATVDPAEITRVWMEQPQANVGGALGYGRVALDDDPAEGSAATLARFLLPATRTHATPHGGRHLVYWAPPGTRGGKLGDGVTVRGLGSYIVLPPSRLADGGAYGVVANRTEVQAPAALLDRLRAVHTSGDGGDLPAEAQVDPARLPRHLRAILQELPGVDRSGQLHHLIAAGVEWGLADGEVVWLARRFTPAVAKYAERLDGEVGRALAKVRPRHPHPGRPCDAAGCPNRPRWMVKTVPDPPTADQGTEVHLAAVPDYPLDAVGGPICDLVAATPWHPAAFVGGAALGALAALAAPASLRLSESWTVRPILWPALVGRASAGKSPALERAWRPLREHGHLVDRILDDLTIEKLARLLDEHAGLAVVWADELTTTLGSLGRYHRHGGASSDRGRLLALWTGAPWRYSRVTSKIDLLIERPTVVVTGDLVTEDHRILGRSGDGMRVRWLPHLAAAVARGQLDLEATGDGGWSEVVEELALRLGDRTWYLDAATRQRFLDARGRWHATADGDEPETVRLAADKGDTHAARIALALAEGLAPGKGGALPPEALDGAVALVDFTLGCWRALGEDEALALSRRDEVLDLAVDRMAAWIERRGQPATSRDLQRAKVGGARTAKQMAAVIERYEERFPGTVEYEVTLTGHGPKATVVHPPRRG